MATVLTGNNVTLDFTITNPNSGTALTGVAFTDILPAGLTVVNNSSTQCGGTLTTITPSTITLVGGNIAAGGNCTISVPVTAASAGIKNNTTGAVTSSNGGTGNTASASVFVADPALTVNKEVSVDNGTSWLPADTAPGPYLLSGTNPQFRFTVNNTGNVDLTVNLSDSDFLLPGGCNPGIILAGGTFSCTYTGASWASGQHTDTATASSSYTDGNGTTRNVSETNDANYFGAAAGLTVTKSSTTSSITAAGQVVPYVFHVTNVGNLNLSVITVVDGNCDAGPTYVSGDTGADGVLGLTEDWTYTCDHTVTQAEIEAGGNLSNTVMADSFESAPDTATLAIPITQAPAIQVTKSGTLDMTGVPPTGMVNVGDTVTYGFTVTNTGNVSLTSIYVTDPLLPGLNCTIPLLSVGTSSSCVATGNVYLLTQVDVDAGRVTNTATVTGTPPSGPDISDTDTYIQLLGIVPELNIVKEVGASSTGPWNDTSITVAEGDDVYYRVSVENTGNIALTGITVGDPDVDMSSCTWNSPLVVGATASCVVGPVTAVAGTHTNTATADSNETGPDTDGASYVTPAAGVVDPAVTKSGSPEQAAVGDTVTFTIVVSNNGNTNADNVVLTDPKPSFLDIVSVVVSPDTGQPITIIGNTLTIDFGTVAPTDVFVITVITQVNSLGQPPGGMNTASISADFDDDPDNNQSSADIEILAEPILLPSTGFAPGMSTILPPRVEGENFQQYSDLWLEIPSLGTKMDIVGVPQKETSWDISWLGKDAGYLYGSAFPTHSGNSIITGHVYLPNGLPGPFVNISSLKYGDRIKVHAYGQTFIYEVRKVEYLKPTDVSKAFEHKEESWVTLLTCRSYDEKTDTYRQRVAIKAVLVKTIR